MRLFSTLTLSTAVLIAAVCLLAQEQSAPSASETRGMPARATPADYQAHAEAGKVAVGAEFFQHTVPTQPILTTEEYVVVEAGVFGPPGAKATVSPEQFSLRINGKKNPTPSEPYALVFKSLKDPEWEPPIPVEEKKSKTGINTGGKGGGDNLPPVIHVPIKTQREWEARATKASFPEGDRALPQAGLLFFRYSGKASKISSLELIYSGPDGKASLALNP
jgi:hypothetical protein